MGYPHHKKLIFKGLQYFFINRKPEKYNTITPNSGRPIKSPTQANGEYECHKEMLFIQGKLQSSMFYLYIGSERSAFQFAPILLAH